MKIHKAVITAAGSDQRYLPLRTIVSASGETKPATENDKEFVIKAELPDVKKEDVKVLVENGVLQISGERYPEKEEKGKKDHRIERAYGSFERSFTLPEKSEADDMTAEYKDGMLTLCVPKTKDDSPKAIEVKVQ